METIRLLKRIRHTTLGEKYLLPGYIGINKAITTSKYIMRDFKKRLYVDLRNRTNTNPYSVTELNNAYKGRKCYIIGNGPSLRIEDLDLLKDKYTFGLNSIYALYDKTLFRPTFYVTGVPRYIEWILCEKKWTWLAKEYVFLNDFDGKQKDLDNIRFIPVFDYYYANYQLISEQLNNEQLIYIEDIQNGILSKMTVAIMAIEIAVYLGFKEIVLTGVDMDYSTKKKYVYEDNDGVFYDESIKWIKEHTGIDDSHLVVDNEKMVRGMREGFKFWDRRSKELGVTILNATRGGKLDVFQRVSLEDVL